MFFDKYQVLCKNAGISDTTAAEAMGFQRSTVTGWKKGKKPKNATIKIVAEYFGVQVDYFDEDDLSVSTGSILNDILTSAADLPKERQADVLNYILFLKSERNP
ncbi:MAG TPA: helix-turn-helix transcriptional regulator [Clostridia bacterium]|nr:helix-turn-helix transcriptional regulator [Clostridia bacterium]